MAELISACWPAVCLYGCCFNSHRPFFLSQVTGVSISPGKDQLVVFHTKDNRDLIVCLQGMVPAGDSRIGELVGTLLSHFKRWHRQGALLRAIWGDSRTLGTGPGHIRLRVPIMIIHPLSCLQCQFRVFKDRTACLALSDWYPLWLFMKREKNVCLLDLRATLSSLVSAKWLHKSWAWYREEIQYVLLDV